MTQLGLGHAIEMCHICFTLDPMVSLFYRNFKDVKMNLLTENAFIFNM